MEGDILMIVVFIIVGLLFFIIGYGLWLTVGPGKKDLRDPIDEHSKMHELGIAHSHKEGTYRLVNDEGTQNTP